MELKTGGLYTSANEEVYYYKKSVLQLIRPLTLTGTITPILVGTGLAMSHGQVRLDAFLALLLSAILIQSATNVLNDYFDFKNGQDKVKWISEDQAEHHGPAHHSLPLLASMMFAAAVGFGLWLALHTSLWVILAGVVGIAAGYKYSAGKKSFSATGLGETIAAIFLGPVITLLAFFVQTNTLNFSIIAVSLVFAMLIASMILTNNIRDIKKDVGFRKTIPYRLGKKNAVHLLKILLALPYIFIFLMAYSGIIPANSILTIFAIPVAMHLLWSFRKDANREEEIDGMKWAARHHWVFGILFALGIWL